MMAGGTSGQGAGARSTFMASAKPAAPAAKDPNSPGARIFHVKFGYGVILRKHGDTLEIAFEKAGIKKVKADFVEKA
jgi:hypothetical protein